MSKCLFLLVGLGLLSGCSGGSGFSTVKAQGKVMFKGKPVPDAAVSFTPQKNMEQGKSSTGMAGKSASGTTDSEGRFVLSTYGTGDGVLLGKHAVSVSASDANKPLPGKSPPNLIVEAKPGGNDFTIELVP